MKTKTNINDGRLELVAVVTFFLILFFFTIFSGSASGQVVNGNSGRCLEFNGTTSGVTFNNSNLSLGSGSAMTVTAWVKCNSTTNEGNWANIVTIDNSSTSASGDDGQFWLQHSQTNSVFEFALENNSSSRVYVQSVTSPVTGQWYHVAGVYDGNYIYLYINGVLESKTAQTGKINNFIGSSYQLVFGQWANPADAYRRFNGDIDEVTVWSVALTQTQIRTYMCKTLQGNESGLVGYWRMNEKSGNGVYDLSASGKNATSVNTIIVWSGAPIGNSSSFTYGGTHLSLSNSTYGDSLTVNNFSSTPTGIQIYLIDTMPNYTTAPSGYASLATKYYYGVYSIGSTTPTFQVNYYYKGNSQIVGPGLYGIATRNDNSVTTWTDFGAVLSTVVKAFQVSGQSGRGEYIPELKTTLPITLLNFDAAVNGNQVDINWSTGSEKNNNYFTIERTTDGVNYEVVATIKGAGNSDHTLSYSANDMNPVKGIAYYRLKQTDFDGTSQVFKCVAVDFSGNDVNSDLNVQNVYPNPFGSSFSISIESNETKELNIEILNANGQLIDNDVFNCVAGVNTYEYIKGYAMTGGVYFVCVLDNSNGQKIVKKVVKQ